MPLLDYQIEPCEKLTKILLEKGSALDASQAGVGKTFVAVHAALRLGLPTGIVCPKALIPSWERVCESEGLKPEFILNYEKLTRGNTGIVFKTGPRFYWGFAGLVIFDEIQKAKSPTSLNSKMVVAAWETQLIRCLCLSATAAQNPMEMRALGLILGLHKGFNWWHWLFSNGAKKSRWGGVEWKGSRNELEKIHKQIFPNRGVRVRIKDLGNAFPENLVIADPLAIDKPEQLNAVYQDAERELAILKEKEGNDFPSAMTVILRARQKAEIIKVPLIVDFAKDLLAEGKSVAIFVNFTATLEMIAEHLKTNCVIRSQKAEERQKNVDDFQSNRERVIVCNIQSGGVGLSLHDLTGEAPRVSLICPTYSAIDLIQCLGRIHRSGGKSPAIQRLIYVADSVEEKVCLRVRSKIDNIAVLNDGDISDGLTWKTNDAENATEENPK